MKKTSKRIISLLLALVMVAGVCAVGFMASAASPVFDSVNNCYYLENEDDNFNHQVGDVTEEGFKPSGVQPHLYRVEGNDKVCTQCGHRYSDSTAHSAYDQLIEKFGNVEATCAGKPYDIYKCKHCSLEYRIETGYALGHYWPVQLNAEGEPVVATDANGNPLKDDNGNDMLSVDMRFAKVDWDKANHESCKLTLYCQRPDCSDGPNGGPGELSYTVYTAYNNDIGQIKKVLPEGYNPSVQCKEWRIYYYATFKIPNVPRTYDADMLYYQTGESDEYVVIEPTKDHQVDDNGFTSLGNGKHSGTCKLCGDPFAVDCTDFTLTDNGDGTHSEVCNVCGYKKNTVAHSFSGYNSNGDGTHTAVCSVCGATDTKNCENYSYPEHNVAGHKKVCADCGYVVAASEAHDFGSYTDNGDGTHSKTCTLCGQTADVALHNPSSYVQAGAEGHRAICEDCGAAYLEAHEEGEPVINVTVAPTCTEEGKQDVTIYCSKCNFKISEQKDVAVPALGHDFVDGVCTRCGASRSCASEGHEIDEELGLNYDGVVHYYTCRYCGASVYPDADGKIVNVTVTINSDGATEVSPNSARHAAQDYYLDDVNELHSFEHCTKCAHKHNFVKMGTITGSCETYSYDTYKCTTCEQKVNVRKGDQLGHYWPIELEDDGLTPKVDEDGSVVFDEDYVSFRWGAKNESCTITLTCKRPDCGKTVSYTIYTKKTDFGMITKKKTCLGTKYIATFTNLPDIPTGSDGTYVLTTTASVETGSGSHTPGKVLEKVDPTCTEAGYTKYECKKCGEDFKVTTPATGHDYQMKTDATGKTWYECKKCGDSYTLTPCRAGQHIDENFDFVCEKCHSKISFRENWPHYIVGLPLYWLRRAISWLFDGRKGNLEF